MREPSKSESRSIEQSFSNECINNCHSSGDPHIDDHPQQIDNSDNDFGDDDQNCLQVEQDTSKIVKLSGATFPHSPKTLSTIDIFNQKLLQPSVSSVPSSQDLLTSIFRENQQVKLPFSLSVSLLLSKQPHQIQHFSSPFEEKNRESTNESLIEDQSSKHIRNESTQNPRENSRSISQLTCKKARVCNCKKTKCLKLYCDCFAVGELCGEDCKCSECCNHEHALTERNTAIEQILERNPLAFNVKQSIESLKSTDYSPFASLINTVSVPLPNSQKKQTPFPSNKKESTNCNGQVPLSCVPVSTNCNCRKSNCLKKYCLCFSSGQICSDTCKCTDCKNISGNISNNPSSIEPTTKKKRIVQTKTESRMIQLSYSTSTPSSLVSNVSSGQSSTDLSFCANQITNGPIVQSDLNPELITAAALNHLFSLISQIEELA